MRFFLRASLSSVLLGFGCFYGIACSDGSNSNPPPQQDPPDGSPTGQLDGGGDARADGANDPPQSRPKGDPCVPISVSAILPRVGNIDELKAQHQTAPPQPPSGTVNVTRNSAGAVTSIRYDSPNSDEDYTEDLQYDSAGRLLSFRHDGAGTKDWTEDYQYGSNGLVLSFRYDASGSDFDFTEDFGYDSQGRILSWRKDASGSTNDLSENFGYDSNGLLYNFRRDATGSAEDLSEDFGYDSERRLISWRIDGEGSNNDATVSISYSSSGSNTQTTGARASGARVLSCTSN